MSKGLLDVVKEWRAEAADISKNQPSGEPQRRRNFLYEKADEAQPFLDRLEALVRDMQGDEGGTICCEGFAARLLLILHGEQPPIQGEGRET